MCWLQWHDLSLIGAKYLPLWRSRDLLDAAAKGYSAYVLIPLYEELLTVYETRTLQMTDPLPAGTP